MISEEAVYPKPIERQKVSHCIQIFNEKTVAALAVHPDLDDSHETATFISMILEFWNIVNVHSPGLDTRFKI